MKNHFHLLWASLLALPLLSAERRSFPCPWSGPATQVEAMVSRNGVMPGAVQIYAVQIGIVPLSPLMLLASAAMSAGQGTRASFVSESFADVFRSVSQGNRSGAWSGGTSSRYMKASKAEE